MQVPGWAAARVAVAVAVAAAGCGIDERDRAEPEPAVVTSALTNGPCPPAGCSSNSPQIDNLVGFHDLSLVGTGTALATQPNNVGLAIVAAGDVRRAQIVQGTRSYDLAVIDGRFVGTCQAPCTPLQGTALTGATITLTVPGPNGPKPSYVMTIGNVRTMNYFLEPTPTPAPRPIVEAYTLTWKSLAGGPSSNVCNNVPLLEQLLDQQRADDTYALWELMRMQPWETVIFEGDRYDERALTTQPTADDTWFNIGCASHMLAKLRLTRNTIHSQTTAVQAWEQRQATMKLLAADYCGGGTPLTVTGQWLVWQGDLMHYYHEPDTIDARWTELGATCIGEPRMLRPTSALGASTFPHVWDSIIAACKLARKPVPPKCTNLDPLSYGGALRVSSNPKL